MLPDEGYLFRSRLAQFCLEWGVQVLNLIKKVLHIIHEDMSLNVYISMEAYDEVSIQNAMRYLCSIKLLELKILD